MSDISAVKALVFDVFGTVVDWRSSLIADFKKWADTRGIKADWIALVDGWRAVYSASMDEVRKHPERGYVILDQLHRQSLEKLVAQFSIAGLNEVGFMTYEQIFDNDRLPERRSHSAGNNPADGVRWPACREWHHHRNGTNRIGRRLRERG